MNEIHELYEKYHNLLMKYALGLTHDYNKAEELVQDTFYKAITSIHKFKGKSKVSVWLCQILKNTFYNQYKKESRIVPLPDQEEHCGVNESAEHVVIQAELLAKILEYITELDKNNREVFELRYFHELSFKEIGNMFHKSESWARVIYFRSKEQLKRKIKEEFGDEV